MKEEEQLDEMMPYSMMRNMTGASKTMLGVNKGGSNPLGLTGKATSAGGGKTFTTSNQALAESTCPIYYGNCW